MTLFRIFLTTVFLVIAGYTFLVGLVHGWNLVPLFFTEIQSMNWQGQFNLDFLTFLLLSALWCAWRNRFSVGGWGLALLGATGGMLFLSAYLLYLSFRTDSNIRTMILGDRA